MALFKINIKHFGMVKGRQPLSNIYFMLSLRSKKIDIV